LIAAMTEIPEEARRLHHEARSAGGRGDYARALSLLEEAHALAPSWAYPLYDAAFTHLLQGDAAQAEELYGIVDKMEPRGFYTCKTSLDVLRREREGSVPEGFAKSFALLEWAEPEEKRGILAGIVERYPGFAPGWKELASLLTDPEEKLAALDNGLAGHPDADTRGMLLLNKALLLHQQGRKDEGTVILRAVAEDPDSTQGNEVWAKRLLASWAG
jgi:tetratricopeptide (TPR) repeat protein